MADFVAYYRVSTDRQGASGLGLEAQRQAVARHMASGDRLLAEFTVVESGRRDANCPQLHAALAQCRRRGATLLIARLDRLARNVAFIAGLMESGADFVAVDMPQANRLTIHILAAVAEHEREMISARTRAALAQARARGQRLGNPPAPSRPGGWPTRPGRSAGPRRLGRCHRPGSSSPHGLQRQAEQRHDRARHRLHGQAARDHPICSRRKHADELIHGRAALCGVQYATPTSPSTNIKKDKR